MNLPKLLEQMHARLAAPQIHESATVQIRRKKDTESDLAFALDVIEIYQEALEEISKHTFEANPWTVIPSGAAKCAIEARAKIERMAKARGE